MQIPAIVSINNIIDKYLLKITNNFNIITNTFCRFNNI